MPLSASRHPLSHLGVPRGERPRCPARADTSVHRLLRGGQSAKREVCSLLLPGIQCRHVRGLREVAAATPFAQPEDGRHSRQRTLSPHQASQAAAEGSSGASRVVVPATLQPATCAHREGLETHPSTGNPQPLLQQPGRVVGCCRDLLRPMGKAEPRPTKTMRHFIRRCV